MLVTSFLLAIPKQTKECDFCHGNYSTDEYENHRVSFSLRNIFCFAHNRKYNFADKLFPKTSTI